MAKIETNSLSGTTTPSGAGSIIRDAQWGIDAVLSGYIIQNIRTDHQRVYDVTYDQKGAEVSELDYDEQWTMEMEVIGGNGNEDGELTGYDVGDINIEWNGHNWKCRGVQYNGTYNDKKRYTLQLFRCANFPESVTP